VRAYRPFPPFYPGITQTRAQCDKEGEADRAGFETNVIGICFRWKIAETKLKRACTWHADTGIGSSLAYKVIPTPGRMNRFLTPQKTILLPITTKRIGSE